MPNHIINRIEFSGDDKIIKKLVDKFSTHYKETNDLTHDGKEIICVDVSGNFVGWFDDKTNVFSTGRGTMRVEAVGLPDEYSYKKVKAWTRFPDFEKVLPMPDDVKSSIGQPGLHPAWYRWAIDNWGTKWNCYSCVQSNGIYDFETAWNTPLKILEAISKAFPGVKIQCVYADENTGYNCGKYTLLNGDGIEVNQPEGGSKEAYDIAFELMPDDKKYYKLIDGNYVYDEEEE